MVVSRAYQSLRDVPADWMYHMQADVHGDVVWRLQYRLLHFIPLRSLRRSQP